MIPRGWYRLYREWANNCVFGDESFCARMAWIWLIERACFEPHTVRIRGTAAMVALNRGQFIIANRVLAKEFGWSVNRVRRFLKLLKNAGMIDTQADTRNTIITICNYDKYQLALPKADTPPATLSDTQADTPPDTRIKNAKKLKKEKYLPSVGTQKPTRFDLIDPPADWIQFCITHRPELNPGNVFDQFRDYWIAKPGKEGCKLDWAATWRNWVRSEKTNKTGENYAKVTKYARSKAAVVAGVEQFRTNLIAGQ